MSTATSIINRAFSKATIKPAETPLSASELADGLDILNDLLSEWAATGILKGVAPVSVVGTDIQEPRYATGALKASIALKLCGEYGIKVSPALLQDVKDSTQNMIAASIDLQHLPPPANLPVGSGNRYSYGAEYDREFFPEIGKRNF